MFKQHNKIYIYIVALLVLAVSCDKFIYDQIDEEDNKAPVYLAITRAAHIDGEESINEDAVDFEDRVHDLAMFVFDTSSDELITSYFDENIPFEDKSKTFQVKLTPGQRDFYFIANMPMSDLKAINSKVALNNYMDAQNDLYSDLYEGAKVDNGFPMSRIYINQSVEKGGTIHQPTPFKPNGEERVRLKRVVAKLEVNLTGEAENMGISNIYFRNANRKFLLTDPGVVAPSEYFNDNSIDVPLKKISDNKYIYYMPEAVISSANWIEEDDNKPINYFTIVTTSGVKYDVPIISNEQNIADSYLAKAKGTFSGFTPNYNIKRNDYYLFKIKNLENIEIVYQVNPWEMVERALYMGYGYNVEVNENGEVVIRNTIDACDPHEVVLKTVGDFKFADGTTEKTFATVEIDASSDYFQLAPIPTTGDGAYLEVHFNDELVKTFTK